MTTTKAHVFIPRFMGVIPHFIKYELGVTIGLGSSQNALHFLNKITRPSMHPALCIAIIVGISLVIVVGVLSVLQDLFARCPLEAPRILKQEPDYRSEQFNDPEDVVP